MSGGAANSLVQHPCVLGIDVVLDCGVVMPFVSYQVAANTKRQPQHKDVEYSCTTTVSVGHLYNY
eukprot:COSAG02_NODE_3129_length_7312_cov_338.294191_4_plen_65_part_00